MADNFLERRREEYEQRKALWLKRKKGKDGKSLPRPIQRRDRGETIF